jgi:O-antigen ligase
MASTITYPVRAATRVRSEGIAAVSADPVRESGAGAARLVLLTTLVLSALAFGSVQAWAWGGTAILAASALLVWAWASVRSGLLKIVWTPLYVPAAMFFLLGLVQFSAHLTADPIATRESLVKFATDFVIFFLVIQLWDSEAARARRKLATAVVIFAGVMAVFSISQFFASPATIYGIVKPRWGGWVFGPYVNHNHYAGLMEMLIPIAICDLLSRRTGPGNRRILTAFAVVVAVASLLLSGSRGGLIAFASEVGLVTLILWRRQPSARRPWFAAAGLAAVAIVAVLFLWLDPGQISKRIGSIADVSRTPEATLGERRALARDSLGIFRDRPGLGTGLGSFATVYPRYRSFPSDLEWDHAHNDYAEVLAETGVVGAAVILTALGLFLVLAFRNLNERLEYVAGWIGLGAAIGCCGLLVHSLADFNLHIPANAAWFGLLAGLAITPVTLSRDGDRKRPDFHSGPNSP